MAAIAAGCHCHTSGPGCCQYRATTGFFIAWTQEQHAEYLRDEIRRLERVVSRDVQDTTQKLVEQYKDTLIALKEAGD